MTIYSDLEGPLVKADYATSLISDIFPVLSSYDDIKFFVEHVKDYNPGNTLLLIAPILHALGKDENYLKQKALKLNDNYVAGAKELTKSTKIRIISTSYEQYVYHITDKNHLNVDKKNVYCTKFPFDELAKDINEADKQLVLEFIKYLSRIKEELTLGPLEKQINKFKTLDERFSLNLLDLPENSLNHYFIIDNFYNVLKKTSYSKMLNSIKPIGGIKKYESLLTALEKDDSNLSEAFTIGDSITDCIMLNETKKAGGLAVSFNGDKFSLLCSDIAIINGDCYITKKIHNKFIELGKKRFLKWANNLGDKIKILI